MTEPAASQQFYAALPGFREFEDFTDFDAYAPVPDDWVILCADIRGSTRAIAEGRYKQVNMVGAAVIAAILNACPGTAIPFVFGGDGGLAAVPGALCDLAVRALVRLQTHSEATFGLGLRAAAIPVARLRSEGHDVRVRKYVLGKGNDLAMFAGSGVERAEEILKTATPEDPALLSPDPGEGAPDLGGLSCRWEPLRAGRGRMIALMVQPLDEAPQVLRATLVALSGILGGGIAGFAPVTDRSLRFRWPPRGLAAEIGPAARRGWRFPAWLWALFTASAQGFSELTGRAVGPYDPGRYRAELKAQTDFRKFDGMLRTVLDVTADQADRIEAWLESEYRAGRLVYGLHRDREALMTCLVFNMERGNHIHFIDAAGGGFARAAEGFKARLAAR